VRFVEPTAIFGLVTATVSQALSQHQRVAVCGAQTPIPANPPMHAAFSPADPSAGLPLAGRPPGRDPVPLTPARCQTPLWRQDRLTDLDVIGLFDDTYILCQGPAGLVLVDQHAAHERVVYEALKRAAVSERPPCQRLLLAEVVELSHRQADALAAALPALGTLGFDIVPFGGASVALTAVPAVFAGRNLGPLITDLADALAATATAADIGTLMEQSLQTMACHRAIRAGQTLDPAQIKALLAQLEGCDDPAHCPHGRPTWILLDRSEIQRRFGRRGPGLL